MSQTAVDELDGKAVHWPGIDAWLKYSKNLDVFEGKSGPLDIRLRLFNGHWLVSVRVKTSVLARARSKTLTRAFTLAETQLKELADHIHVAFARGSMAAPRG